MQNDLRCSFHRRIYLIWMLPRLLLNLMSGYKLMYISVFENTAEASFTSKILNSLCRCHCPEKSLSSLAIPEIPTVSRAKFTKAGGHHSRMLLTCLC